MTENMFQDCLSDVAFLRSHSGMEAITLLHVEGICEYLARQISKRSSPSSSALAPSERLDSRCSGISRLRDFHSIKFRPADIPVWLNASRERLLRAPRPLRLRLRCQREKRCQDSEPSSEKLSRNAPSVDRLPPPRLKRSSMQRRYGDNPEARNAGKIDRPGGRLAWRHFPETIGADRDI